HCQADATATSRHQRRLSGQLAHSSSPAHGISFQTSAATARPKTTANGPAHHNHRLFGGGSSLGAASGSISTTGPEALAATGSSSATGVYSVVGRLSTRSRTPAPHLGQRILYPDGPGRKRSTAPQRQRPRWVSMVCPRREGRLYYTLSRGG